MRTLDPTHTPEYRAVMTVVCLGCGLAALGSVLPAVDQVVNVGMLVLGILVALVAVVRLLVRFVRERCEDAADARTAAAWRVTNHPAGQACNRAGQARLPAGVA